MLASVTRMPEVLIKDRWLPAELRQRMALWQPRSNLGAVVKDCLRFLPEHMAAELFERIAACVVIESRLSLVVFRHPDSPWRGRSLVEDYGIVSRRLVTDNGADFITDAFRNSVEAEIMNYHALGTGVAAEGATDSALGTEWVAGDYTGGVRATGTQSEPAAKQYRTVGTNTKLSAGTSAVTEHGVFSVSTAGSGVLLDRSGFAAVNLTQNDSAQTTYTFSAASGG